MRAGSAYIDISTSTPWLAQEIAEAANAVGVDAFDAPLSSGGVYIGVGGDRQAFERWRPVLEAAGDHVSYVGGPGMGQALKLVRQYVGFSHFMAEAEALVIAAKAGLDVKATAEFVGASVGGSAFRDRVFGALFARDFGTPGQAPSALDIVAKDLQLAVELARRVHAPATIELAQHATKAVRLLGEDLVLYKDESGQLGLIGRYCAHRLADLVYGMPTADGLRCSYHGWKYDCTGQCTEQPFEEVVRPGGFKDKVKLAGYPVEELGGLIFAYLGPQPAPQLPRWDVFVEPDAEREIGHTITNCNWLQTIENALDPVHVEWLHGEFRNYARKFTGGAQRTVTHRKHLKIAFDLKEYGIVKRRLLEGEPEDHDDWRIGHWMVFPNAQKGSDMMRFRIPRDDYSTAQFYYTCRKSEGVSQRPEDIPLYEMPSPTLDRQ